MSKLFTVDVDSGSTKLIDVTIDEFRDDLVHPITKVYVYVGQEKDAGWKAALSAAGLLPDLNPYLANGIDILREWVPTGDPTGIVFGTDDQPDRLLDKAEAAVSKIVLKANAEAQ
jgi:hypothetical protein